MTDNERPISEAFLAMASMFERRGRVPLKGKLVTETCGPWQVCMNGTPETIRVDPPDSMGCDEVPPVHAAIFFNGWLAGVLSPFGGWIAAGEAANEATFTAAMEAG